MSGFILNKSLKVHKIHYYSDIWDIAKMSILQRQFRKRPYEESVV